MATMSTMNMMTPESYSKRSPLYRQLPEAEYAEQSGAALIVSVPAAVPAESGAVTGLLDLSVLSRTGLRGPNSAAVLKAAGYPFPDKPNQAQISDSGELVLRLSKTECWILDTALAGDDGQHNLALRAENEPACYPLYCQDSHCWLMLSGPHLADIMAKICGVDLRPDNFSSGAIAQTSVARVGAIVVSHSFKGVPVFSILSDSAAAEYLWQALLDASQEFGGQPLGVNDLS